MTHDPYWNHFLRSADLAAAAPVIPSENEKKPNEINDLQAPLEVPAPHEAEVETPLPPDPDPPFGMLDGVTPEELARARIAKHKELLTPPAEPVALELAAMRASVDNTRLTLAAILAVLRQIRDRLPGGGHH